MRKAYLLHGFNVKDGGAGTIAKLAPYLRDRGFDPVSLDYGWAHRVSVRLCNKRLAHFLADLAEPDSVAIGHSNGCALIHLATHLGARFREVSYINPALDVDAAPWHQVQQFHVWHSQSDVPTRLARWIPFSPWGAMGAKGYQGTDNRARNHDLEADGFQDVGHSDVFSDSMLAYYGPHIAEALEL